MSYILFLVILSLGINLYLYCILKEIVCVVGENKVKINYLNDVNANCLCNKNNIIIIGLVSDLDQIQTQLEVFEARLDGQHSVISCSLNEGSTKIYDIQSTLSKHKKKILTLEKKFKKEKTKQKEAKV